MVRVLVVDDYQPWLFFMRSMLQEACGFQVIGEASDGDEAVQKAVQLEPDLILLDIGLPILHGIEAARLIRKHNPRATILFVSEHRSGDVVRKALSAGSGYVVKSYAPRELLPAINTVLGGGRFVSACLDGDNSTDSSKGEFKSKGKAHVNCYPDRATFVDGFARFVGESLHNGCAIVVLASESHRVGILQRLKSQGVDVATAIDQKRYFPLDIPDGFQTFKFAEYLATDAVKAARERNLRVGVGSECAHVLWSHGKADKPKQHECVWNEFVETWDIDIWCGCFEKPHSEEVPNLLIAANQPTADSKQ